MGAFFDPEAVKQLKRIVDVTCADIVIESSWKYLAYWSFFRIKSLKTPIITYICGIYKFRYAKNAFSVALKM